jgi:hypothetical protein
VEEVGGTTSVEMGAGDFLEMKEVLLACFLRLVQLAIWSCVLVSLRRV